MKNKKTLICLLLSVCFIGAFGGVFYYAFVPNWMPVLYAVSVVGMALGCGLLGFIKNIKTAAAGFAVSCAGAFLATTLTKAVYNIEDLTAAYCLYGYVGLCFIVLLAAVIFIKHKPGRIFKTAVSVVAAAVIIAAVMPVIKSQIFYGEKIMFISDCYINSVPLQKNGAAEFAVRNKENLLNCRLSYCGKAGWRIQTEYSGVISDYGASQLLAYYLDEEEHCKAEKISADINESKAVFKAPDGSSAELTYSPFSLVFKNKSGDTAAEISDIVFRDGASIVRGRLEKKEAMWGGGEHFDHVNQRGCHVVINAIDKWAETRGNSYMPIPILISSRGSGLFMNRFERMTIDVDSNIVPGDFWQFTVPSAPCDLFIVASDTPADTLYAYSLLTGFSPEPVEWNYGTIVCRYSPDFQTVDGVLDMAKAMGENDFPWEGVIVEGFDASNKAELQRMTDAVHALGKKIMVYSATGRNMLWSDGDETEYLVKRADKGSVDIPQASSDNPVDNPDSSTARYFDITSEKTRDYIFGSLWDGAVNDCGIDGSKIDFCEQFPDFIELDLADGQTSGAHHWYPVLFNTLLYNKLNEREDGCFALVRGGGIGAQRYPFVWMGDQTRDFRFLSAQIKGVLSSGISGIPFTSFDMAGYMPGSDDEAAVMTRAVEFTAFTGNIQTHGKVLRPYDFDDETKAVYRKFTKIHDALRPYLVEQGKISCKTGLPLVRHLALSYWTDENVWDIEDEFMLGESLLVAPVLDNSESRDIYLPEGSWKNLFTGEVFDGNITLKNYSVPEKEIPVFVNQNAVSPAFAECEAAVLAVK